VRFHDLGLLTPDVRGRLEASAADPLDFGLGNGTNGLSALGAGPPRVQTGLTPGRLSRQGRAQTDREVRLEPHRKRPFGGRFPVLALQISRCLLPPSNDGPPARPPPRPRRGPRTTTLEFRLPSLSRWLPTHTTGSGQWSGAPTRTVGPSASTGRAKRRRSRRTGPLLEGCYGGGSCYGPTHFERARAKDFGPWRGHRILSKHEKRHPRRSAKEGSIVKHANGGAEYPGPRLFRTSARPPARLRPASRHIRGEP